MAYYFRKRVATLSNQLVPMEPRDTPLVDIVQALEEHWNIMIKLQEMQQMKVKIWWTRMQLLTLMNAS